MTKDQLKQLRKEAKQFMKGLSTDDIRYDNRTLILHHPDRDSNQVDGDVMKQLAEQMTDMICKWMDDNGLQYVVCDEFLSTSYPIYTYSKSIVPKDVYDRAIEECPNRKYFIHSKDQHIAVGSAYGGPYAKTFINL